MHIDAVFDAATGSPAGQCFVGGGVDRETGRIGIDYTGGVFRHHSTALHVEHRMTVDRTDPRGKGIVPIANFCSCNRIINSNLRWIHQDRTLQVDVADVIFQAEEREWGRLPIVAYRTAADETRV